MKVLVDFPADTYYRAPTMGESDVSMCYTNCCKMVLQRRRCSNYFSN